MLAQHRAVERVADDVAALREQVAIQLRRRITERAFRRVEDAVGERRPLARIAKHGLRLGGREPGELRDELRATLADRLAQLLAMIDEELPRSRRAGLLALEQHRQLGAEAE